jgi:hypothetical protein
MGKGKQESTARRAVRGTLNLNGFNGMETLKNSPLCQKTQWAGKKAGKVRKIKGKKTL